MKRPICDEELLTKFEDTSLPIDCFHHEEHLRVAFLYLRKYPVLEVLSRFPAHLKRYAAAHGKTELYHETITWAYLFIIGERLTRAAQPQTWEEFRRENTDLCDSRSPILKEYYHEETLASAFSRERFVMPDRFPARTAHMIQNFEPFKMQ